MRSLRELCEEKTWHDRPMRVRMIVQCTRAGSCNARARSFDATRTSGNAMRKIERCDARGTDSRADRVDTIADESVARDRGVIVTTSMTGWCVRTRATNSKDQTNRGRAAYSYRTPVARFASPTSTSPHEAP
jgi:hypothetical protein